MKQLAARRTVELKIPAQGPFIVVAKRAAAALGSAAGFTLEGIDDINIAVAQACEKAIAAGDRMWGPGTAELKLIFGLVPGGIELEVKTMPVRETAAEAAVRQQRQRRQPALARRLAAPDELDLDDVAVNMIRLFVDELRYNVDRRGSMRMRMVKYLVE